MITPTISVRESYAQAWRLFWREGFWSYSVLCFLVGSAAILLLLGLAVWIVVPGIENLVSRTAGFSGWWVTVVAWLLFLGVLIILMKPVMLLAMGPILQKVSDSTERKLSHTAAAATRKPGTVRGLYNAVVLGIRNTFLELLIQGFLMLLGLIIPFLGGIAGTILGTAVSAYYWGFSTYDFVLEGKGFSNRQKINFIKKYPQETTKVGIAFLILFLIPVVGLFLAPVLGVMAATIHANGLMLKNPDTNPFNRQSTHSMM